MLRQRLLVTILSRAFLGTIAIAGLALNAQVGWAQLNEKKTEQQKLEGTPLNTKPQAAAEPPAEFPATKVAWEGAGPDGPFAVIHS